MRGHSWASARLPAPLLARLLLRKHAMPPTRVREIELGVMVTNTEVFSKQSLPLLNVYLSLWFLCKKVIVRSLLVQLVSVF